MTMDHACEVRMDLVTKDGEVIVLEEKASPKHKQIVDEFVCRLDAVLLWDRAAVDATVEVKRQLTEAGTPIGDNDTAIAGHALAAGCTLVTNNVREFGRVPGLEYEDWAH
jgi:tRNA(fMet)-specific endonuclease VapC